MIAVSQQSKGLGKGLDALFGSAPAMQPDALRFGNEPIKELAIEDIVPNPDQPRRHFDQRALNELAASIKEFGVLQPLVVTKIEQNKYSIIAGERRWRASQIAGLNKVPVVIRSSNELEQLEVALIENVQREDLTPLEQAVSIQRLHDQFSLSYERIAAKLGKGYSTVANLVRLLQLPQPIQRALQEKQITEGHARALLSLQADQEAQETLLGLILKSHLSVRQAEQYVVALRQDVSKTKAANRTSAETPETKRLSKRLGFQVGIQRLAKGGKLTIRYRNDEDLDALIKRLNDA